MQNELWPYEKEYKISLKSHKQYFIKSPGVMHDNSKDEFSMSIRNGKLPFMLSYFLVDCLHHPANSFVRQNTVQETNTC